MHKLKDIESAQRYIATHGYDKHDKNRGLLPVEDPRIIDLIRDDIVDPKAAKLTSKLSTLISYRNLAFTNTLEISEILEIDKTNIAKKLAYLDKEGLVHCIITNGATNINRTLVFNPSLYWKGSYQLRNIVEERVLIRGHNWRDLAKPSIMKLMNERTDFNYADELSGLLGGDGL